MNNASLGAEERAVLVECARRMGEIADLPDPPEWRTWEVREVEELREYGPRYSPAEWFGGGHPVPERYRVRYLRAVHELSAAGLLVRGTVGKRLANLKLTAEGEKVAAELTGGPKKKPAAKNRRKPGKAPASVPEPPAGAAPIDPAGQ